MESTLSLLDVSAANKGIHLAYAMGPGVPGHLVGDQGRLRQVLSNLVGNAVKFTPKGEVVLTIGVEGHARAARSPLLFRVTDTGIGHCGGQSGTYLREFHPGLLIGPTFNTAARVSACQFQKASWR